jgi:uncharacterized protein (DUF608 family)
MRQHSRFQFYHSVILTSVIFFGILISSCQKEFNKESVHEFNGWYGGDHLNRLAFPIGGIGSGMVALEGNGGLSQVSVRNQPALNNEPNQYAVIHVKGFENGTKILEGPVPDWKIFGRHGSGRGLPIDNLGFPRFDFARFRARFPFGEIRLSDPDIPMKVTVTGWSPFIPTDPDNSSLPVGAMEYHFKNTTDKKLEAIFSYHTDNFMRLGKTGASIEAFPNGLLLHQSGSQDNPHYQGGFVFFIQGDNVSANYSWFSRGVLWKALEKGTIRSDPPGNNTTGASLYKPITLEPGASQTVRLLFAWYVPNTNLRTDMPQINPGDGGRSIKTTISSSRSYAKEAYYTTAQYYKPWYAVKYKSIGEIAGYWNDHYEQLKETSTAFKDAFYASTLPDVVTDAVGANLAILKSPTILRTRKGRLYGWEGSAVNRGQGHNTVHVWNYAQALPHLFPSLVHAMRETEFFVNQNVEGNQGLRTHLPIRPKDTEPPAADGQLGGIMKVYREWRISGDTEWLRGLWSRIEESWEFCSEYWDPRQKGILEEPQFNTYDVSFWGPNSMLSSFYLGAMQAMIKMGNALGEDVSEYEQLFEKGKYTLETELYNGEYFYQAIMTEELKAPGPLETERNISPSVKEIYQREGPNNQYGAGVLADGVLGQWIARMCGLDDFLDPDKVKSHLNAVHQYNFREDFYDHFCEYRYQMANEDEAGLLNCTWPKGGELTFPFRYGREVWTGIEYQVASHLMLCGEVEKGLDIVKAVRNRYDGTERNPFSEYEWGYYYTRAMSSYGLLQGLTGIRYDAIDKTLYINSRIGDDFTSFLSTANGWGNAGLKNGKPFLKVKYGEIPVENIVISGNKAD